MKNNIQSNKRRAAFTLIEIMAVVVIMGLLMGIVGTVVVGQFYQMDNGRFPDNEQGLQALVEQPSSGAEARNWRPGGYLQGGAVPTDPWGEPYQYEYPGSQNAHSFDLWTLGSDGAPGGEGANQDVGNWLDAADG